jgi:hypothetical protein
MWELRLFLTLGRGEFKPSAEPRRKESVFMALDDLKNFAKGLSAEVDTTHKAHVAAAQRLENDRVDFLRGFRDIADQQIRPVFEAVLLKSESTTITLDNRSDLIGIDVRVRNGETSISGRLRYRADPERRQIFREEKIDRLPNRDRDQLVYPPEEFNQERIGQLVESLLVAVKYALYNKRAY